MCANRVRPKIFLAMLCLLLIIEQTYAFNINESISETLDIESLKKITENDVITIVRRCEDVEGRKTYLSISATQIKLDRKSVMEAFLTTSILRKAVPNIKDVRVLRKKGDGKYEVEYEVELKISFIKTSVRYIAEVKVDGNRIISVIKEGKNKGGWRITEFFDVEPEKSTLVVLAMCEYIRGIPIAESIFSDNPQYEIGTISSSTLIFLLSMKKYIESMMRQ